ncbi:MAG: hypothetical protein EAZ90_17195 [Oscillatoriales cyanobacterium]|nr:MAG: hypothetical protein EAZ94_17830 [Oscillatoriales cyanobacterium]TAE22407.1 MAG: hypothetical protein EAZ93_17875 [Oscillatoriales cyanobacterium]TAE41918.1 MAG: hypothetical protein EAZ90_17195 [Oscillatoriales cyanobacterium]TAE51737.1 MAG: hypothetical protein EAZ88_17385 [Oscillatoriales cyanobacterium]TAE70008.1 MAG: hypothetical protein EAZ86_08440 [Oscillatoriales cyanobacterium]
MIRYIYARALKRNYVPIEKFHRVHKYLYSNIRRNSANPPGLDFLILSDRQIDKILPNCGKIVLVKFRNI